MRKTIILTVLALSAFFIILIGLNYLYLYSNRPVVKSVTIHEGLNNREISKILSADGVLVGEELPGELDGFLFPDTYEFFVPSSRDAVINKMRKRFDEQVLPIIPDGRDMKEILTAASLIEKEVANKADRKTVSDIIWKRLARGMFLEIDASICYVKSSPCHPISKNDLKIDSPYNTYLYKGLPPGPINNPSLESIEAAIYPQKSPYWFYLSPESGDRTIFSVDLDEHRANIVKYLE